MIEWYDILNVYSFEELFQWIPLQMNRYSRIAFQLASNSGDVDVTQNEDNSTISYRA